MFKGFAYTFQILIATSLAIPLCSQTIEEKLSSLEASSTHKIETLTAPRINQMLIQLRQSLNAKYREIDQLIEVKAQESEYKDLLVEINDLRSDKAALEEKWRQLQTDEMLTDSEAYGIWEQDDVTISQLVLEYGSQDYLYIVPPELGAMKLSFHSALMIPRESWPDLLEAIVNQNGIGMRALNPYTKQLYLLKQDHLAITSIVTEPYELNALDSDTRVAFILSPPIEHLKQMFYFLERFRDPKTTFVYQVGTNIALIGFQPEIKKLIKLCQNVWREEHNKVTKVVTTSKIQPEEVVKILKSFFGGLADAGRSIVSIKGGNDLTVLPLVHENGVVLIGNRKTVARAEEIIRETEGQVNDPSEKTIFWYTCSHCNPNELSDVLDQVYTSLIFTDSESGDFASGEVDDPMDMPFPGNNGHPPPGVDLDGHAQPHPQRTWGRQTAPVELPEQIQSAPKEKPATFIPNANTGTVLMVIRKDLLGKIKEVIKRFDIPQRMVEIEVLLCERRLTHTGRSGINLLKLGSTASNTGSSALEYNASGAKSTGLLEFLLHGKKSSSFPAIDLTYQFLLSQEDVRVTASPSVITINQEPATISITDQISISNGASPVDSNGGIIFKESFERADFGINITLIPTVHEPGIDENEDDIYITLENDISFENIKGEGTSNHKPEVHKRSIKNQVRIPNGQTIILGGLKYKSAEDKNEKIPFLGDIPGIGKLFGTTALTDKANEMFIFIKPRVIEDPHRDLMRIKEEQLRIRPGDLDHLLVKICEARKRKDISRFKETFDLMFGGRSDETCNL